MDLYCKFYTTDTTRKEQTGCECQRGRLGRLQRYVDCQSAVHVGVSNERSWIGSGRVATELGVRQGSVGAGIDVERSFEGTSAAKDAVGKSRQVDHTRRLVRDGVGGEVGVTHRHTDDELGTDEIGVRQGILANQTRCGVNGTVVLGEHIIRRVRGKEGSERSTGVAGGRQIGPHSLRNVSFVGAGKHRGTCVLASIW